MPLDKPAMSSLKFVVSTPTLPSSNKPADYHQRSVHLLLRFPFCPYDIQQHEAIPASFSSSSSSSSSSSTTFSSNRTEPATSRGSYIGDGESKASDNDNGSSFEFFVKDSDDDEDSHDGDEGDGCDDDSVFNGELSRVPSGKSKKEKEASDDVEQLTGALSRYLWSPKRRVSLVESPLSYQERRDLANRVSADDPLLLYTLDSLKLKLAPSDVGSILFRFGKEKKLDKVCLVFDWMKANKKLRAKSVALFMSIVGKAGLQWKAIKEYREITDPRLKCDRFVCNMIIKWFVHWGSIDKAFRFFDECKANGFNPDGFTYNTLIAGCAKQKDGYVKAKNMLAEMSLRGVRPDSFTYASLLHVCASMGLEDEARGLFEEMRAHQIVPGIFHYSPLLNLYARKGKWEEAEQVFNQIKDLELPLNEVVLNSLMKAYVRAGQVEKAKEMFNQMDALGFPPGEITYSLLVDAYCKNNMVEEAESLLNEMKKKGVTPGRYAFNSIITANGKLKRVDKVLSLEKIVEDINGDTDLYNTLLKCYCELGMNDAVMRILEKMEKLSLMKDRATFNILLTYFSKEGLIEFALRTQSELKLRKLRPNLNSYAPVIEALAGAGKVDQALGLFKEMEEAGIMTSARVLGFLVNSLCKEKRLNEAYKYFCKFMAMKCKIPEPECVDTMLIQAGSDMDLLDRVLELISFSDLKMVDLVAVFSAYRVGMHGAASVKLCEHLIKSRYGHDESREGLQNLICSLQEAGQIELGSMLSVHLEKMTSELTTSTAS